MSVNPFLGMVGTGEWDNEERPKRFRQGILKLFPNGKMPLTAISSMGRSERADDPEFKWYSKDLALQGGDLTGVFNDPALGSGAEYTTGTASIGTVVHCKVSLATAGHFRAGHSVVLVKKTNIANAVWGYVTEVYKNGASSRISVRLITAATASQLDVGETAGVDYIDIIGNANEEGSAIPDSVNYKASKFSNYTQIFRTPVSITRTQRRTRMRTGDVYTEQLREALQYHGIEMEKACLFGQKYEDTSGEEVMRFTQGLVPFIQEHNSGNVVSYTTDSTLAWRQGGEDWLDEKLEVLFRYGREEKMAFCGAKALMGINKIVKQNSFHTLTPTKAAYGVNVMEWVTPVGRIFVKTHPLYTQQERLHNSITIFEPENKRWMYIDDTHFKRDDTEKKAGFQAIDGTKEEYLTEGGYEWHFPETMMHMSAVGLDPS